ncbi:hypothetical protein [Anianabacter salinae]|uniref:hypothetical protein n=1 Tax=Anianabacter salinae TaxID=2851023 RepID=UPI00225DD608|nr:hypothetical protein [Anianabacter salinae]MBV0912469.1 hypothetical protein [Anianabacter salinae]
MTPRPILAALTMVLAALPGTALAQEADTEIGAHLSIELNSAATDAGGCVLSFVAINGHPADIGSAVLETVLFDASGQVERLTLFDFGALPSARPRVRQFAVAGTTCNALSALLINGAEECVSADLGEDACTAGIELRSRTDIEVMG